MPTTILTGVTKWLWEIYGKELTNGAIETVKHRWQKFSWEDAQIKYKNRLRSQHELMSVLDRQVSVQNIFTDIYVLEKVTALHRYELNQLETHLITHKSYQVDSNRRSLRDTMEAVKRIFLLGKPGAGKTTFLKYLTLQACTGHIHRTPIFIALHTLAEKDSSILDYIVEQFDICSFPDAHSFIKHVLIKGNAMVLFDGLDEVIESRQEQIVTQIKEFSNRYPEIVICISCRVGAFEQSLDNFTYVEIADFDKTQITKFSRKWFKDRFDLLGKFLRKLDAPENNRLQELARTPLLLALLCIVFEESSQFPTRIVDLYKEALDVLLAKWDAKRGISRANDYYRLSLRQKELLLAKLADQNFREERYFFEQRLLVRQIEDYFRQLPPANLDDVDGTKILKAIEAQHGLLVERSRQIFSFSHMAFQEFLTAEYIVENAGNNTVNELISHHLLEKRWSEILLATFSLLADSTLFFEDFLRTVWSIVKDQNDIKWLLDWSNGKASKSSRPGLSNRLVFLFWALVFVRSKSPEISDKLGHARELVEQVAMHTRNGVELEIEFMKAKEVALDLAQSGKMNIRNTRYCFSELGTELNDEDINRLWKLSPDQAILLQKYLSANLMLLKCLNLSTLKDRRSVESRLLIPISMLGE